MEDALIISRSLMMRRALLPVTPSKSHMSRWIESTFANCRGGSWKRRYSATLSTVMHPERRRKARAARFDTPRLRSHAVTSVRLVYRSSLGRTGRRERTSARGAGLVRGAYRSTMTLCYVQDHGAESSKAAFRERCQRAASAPGSARRERMRVQGCGSEG